MDWITAHIGAVIGFGLPTLLLLLLLGRKILPRAVTLVKWLWTATQTIHDTEAKLTSAAERREQEAVKRCQELESEKERLEVENEQLAKDLKEETRKVLVREQINSEDTAYIRALTTRLRRKRVDYSDINAEFNRTD